MAQRINPAQEGLHTIITADLAELGAALARDARATRQPARRKEHPDDHA